PLQFEKQNSIKSISDNIEKAKADKKIKGILLRINNNTMGWAKIDEIKQKLDDFKNSGKYVIAYLGSFVSESEYYLALSADSIFAVPGGFMEMNGLVTETVHLPGLFEKLGITIDYFAYGKYKSRSGEEMGRKKHTAPVLEMLNDLLDWQYNHMVSAIAARLNLSQSEIKNTIDKGYLTPEKFLELGWIDGILYEDQVFDKLKALNGISQTRKLNQISSATYSDISLESLGLNKGKDRIALIYSQGVIMEGDDTVDPISFEESAGTDPMIRAIRNAVKSNSVKAIVFRVDSPGGSGLGCDLVWREILQAKGKKPVIVSMSDYAASGGYWVSMGATAIVSHPSSLTGSIGIWSIFPNIGGLYDKLGLVAENVKRGKHADMFLGSKKLDDYERKLMSDRLFETYKEFVNKAATSRAMTYQQLEPHAQGRAWMGEQAKKYGLVDELGGMDQAIALAKEKANIDSSAQVKVVVYTMKKNWIEKLISDPIIGLLFKKSPAENIIEKWQAMMEQQHVLFWPMMPYRIRIQ
ncbi:signal peptide peptidase SppA, partial [candidate division KSB1 bacterium]|nr:signal peptide peptidase SppA [candidate division KSB1 bacterium]